MANNRKPFEVSRESKDKANEPFFFDYEEMKAISRPIIPYSENEILGAKDLPEHLIHFKTALERAYKSGGPTRKTIFTPEQRDNIVKLYLQIQGREQDFSDMYQMLHAQDSFFFAYQVIAKILYELQSEKHYSKFKFLRYPNEKFTKTTHEFFQKFPDVNDTRPEVSEQLTAVSFAMETYLNLDSSLYGLLTGESITLKCFSKNNEEYRLKLKNILEKIFDSAKISPDLYELYLNELIDKAPKSSAGIITQIFIPKNQIKDHLYISTSGGFFDPESNQNISEFLDDFKLSRKDKNFNVKKNVQGRLISGSLNVNAPGIKIYRYTLIPKDERVAYKKFAEGVLNKILNQKSEVTKSMLLKQKISSQ